MPRPTLKDWLILAFLGVIWGGSFTGIGFAAQEVAPLTLAATRLAVGAAALALVCLATRTAPPSFHAAGAAAFWSSAAAVAFLANAAPFTLLAWGQARVPSAVAGVIMAAIPLMVLVLAHYFTTGDRFTWRKALGVVLGLCGMIALFGPAAAEGFSAESQALLGQLACLLAATGYACGGIAMRRSPPAHPFAFGVAALSIALVMIAPLALALEGPPWRADISGASWAAMVWLGLGPTAIATLALYVLINRVGPNFLSLVNYQVPLWAILFGVLLLGESLPPATPVALAFILLGVAAAQLRLPKPRRRVR